MSKQFRQLQPGDKIYDVYSYNDKTCQIKITECDIISVHNIGGMITIRYNTIFPNGSQHQITVGINDKKKAESKLNVNAKFSVATNMQLAMECKGCMISGRNKSYRKQYGKTN